MSGGTAGDVWQVGLDKAGLACQPMLLPVFAAAHKRWPAVVCRYGALKTLGEKKTAFNEYVQARKKEEAEEARQRRMKVRAGWYSGQRCCTQAGGSHVQALQLGARARGCCWQPCARC